MRGQEVCSISQANTTKYTKYTKMIGLLGNNSGSNHRCSSAARPANQPDGQAGLCSPSRLVQGFTAELVLGKDESRRSWCCCPAILSHPLGPQRCSGRMRRLSVSQGRFVGGRRSCQLRSANSTQGQAVYLTAQTFSKLTSCSSGQCRKSTPANYSCRPDRCRRGPPFRQLGNRIAAARHTKSWKPGSEIRKRRYLQSRP
jgi:hypothetical protein